MSEKEPISAETEKEGNVDLSLLYFNFCEDEDVKVYFDEKIPEMKDRDAWIEKNKKSIVDSEKEIAKAVGQGLIPDGRPETLWKFNLDRMVRSEKKIVEVKKELENRIEELRAEVAKRLAKFLPDWNCKKIPIQFKISEVADFCIENGVITVDLLRLSAKDEFWEKAVQGATHEVFHAWMEKKQEGKIKEEIIFHTINEGLAVLISGQSLVEHYEARGIDYKEAMKDFFKFFDDFRKEKNKEKLAKMEEEGFKNMGPFYVVGYEVAKSVLKKLGIEKFRKMVAEAGDNPQAFFDEFENK